MSAAVRTSTGTTLIEAQCCSLDLQSLRVSLGVGYVVHQSDPRHTGDELARKLKLFCRQALHVRRYSRYVAARPRFACDQAKSNRIAQRSDDDWDGISRFFGSNGIETCRHHDDIRMLLNQLCRKLGQTFRMEIRKPINNFEILTFGVIKVSHAF